MHIMIDSKTSAYKERQTAFRYMYWLFGVGDKKYQSKLNFYGYLIGMGFEIEGGLPLVVGG